MVKFMKEVQSQIMRKLAVPCYKFLMPTEKLLLVDAFFLGSVKVPARRALLIFPVKVGINAGEGLVSLNPGYTPSDALRYLVSALEWSVREKYEVSLSRFKKFRLSLIFPIAWFRKGDRLIKAGEEGALIDDAELNAAISLLKGVLEGVRHRLDEVKYKGNAYIPLTAKGDCSGLHELISSFWDVSRNYNWLLKTDTGFRKKMNDLFLNLTGCGIK